MRRFLERTYSSINGGENLFKENLLKILLQKYSNKIIWESLSLAFTKTVVNQLSPA